MVPLITLCTATRGVGRPAALQTNKDEPLILTRADDTIGNVPESEKPCTAVCKSGCCCWVNKISRLGFKRKQFDCMRFLFETTERAPLLHLLFKWRLYLVNVPKRKRNSCSLYFGESLQIIFIYVVFELDRLYRNCWQKSSLSYKRTAPTASTDALCSHPCGRTFWRLHTWTKTNPVNVISLRSSNSEHFYFVQSCDLH